MFRQLCHIVLALTLIFATTGVSVSKHYCMERLLSMSIGETEKSCCNEAEAMGCCHNETERLHVEDDFNPTDINKLPQVELPVLYTLTSFDIFNDIIDTEHQQFYTDSSPPLVEPDIYLTVQSFLL